MHFAMFSIESGILAAPTKPHRRYTKKLDNRPKQLKCYKIIVIGLLVSCLTLLIPLTNYTEKPKQPSNRQKRTQLLVHHNRKPQKEIPQYLFSFFL